MTTTSSSSAHYDTIVLSGNSTNAVVTMGGIQVLQDKGQLTRLKYYVGTSSGSILGCLMSVGYTPLEILCYLCVNKPYSKIKGLDISNLLGPTSGGGMISFEPIAEELRILFTNKLGFVPTLKQIDVLFDKIVILVTYNLTKQERMYIRASTHPDLSVIDAIHMSSNFPFVFDHFCYENDYYVDGGIVDNFPVEYSETLGKKCIGFHTVNEVSPFSIHDSHLEYIRKLFFTFIQIYVEDKIDRATHTDVVTLKHPPNFFNFESSVNSLIQLFDQGYDQTCNLFSGSFKNE